MLKVQVGDIVKCIGSSTRYRVTDILGDKARLYGLDYVEPKTGERRPFPNVVNYLAVPLDRLEDA